MLNFIVLAGGSGTRLFPISRERYPKQFVKFEKNDSSFFQQTIKRLIKTHQEIKLPSTIWIVTNENYKFYVRNNINEIYKDLGLSIKDLDVQIIYEPKGKNTAPAIALALRKALEAGKKEEEIYFVFPSDHVIKPEEAFISDILKAIKYAKEGYIVTFGIKPTYPETGYGYIKVKNLIEEKVYRVEAFVEKPSKELAENYLKEGLYYWNSGIFVFSGKTIIEEFNLYVPEIAKLFHISEKDLENYFINTIPEISIDYAVMEKSKKIVLIAASFAWSDLGSWDSVYDVFQKDDDGNVKLGNIKSLECKNCLLVGNDNKLLITLGLEDVIVIETSDVLLVMKRGKSQKVKDIVKMLKDEGSTSVKEHLTDYRPWGSFTLLERGERYKIKKIIVKPGEALSLQMHYHRSEHWVVVRGTAKVQIGNEVKFVHENESIYIPKSTLHRLENPGKIPLEIIEVQVGEYVEEDDIIRFSDNYGR